MAIAGNRLCIRIFFQRFFIPAKAGRLSPTQPPSGSKSPAPRKKRLIIIGADETLIAIPSAADGEMRRIVNICKESGLKFKTLPGYGELIDGQVTISAIREVDYRDLLRRRPVRLDEEMIAGYLRGRSILITGAGGSIGSELCRQIARFHPGRMVLLDRAESPLFEIEYDLKRDFPNLKFHPVLGDILDRRLLRSLFGDHRPRIVFHAAAYKHVSMLEMQPWKAVENNIVGPEVTRFFMTIREACQLILQACAMGSGGEIFILDMGTPVRIRDMARDLIRLSGFEPDVDVSIVYTGLRPGEKLFEELIIENEDVLPTPHQKILALKGGPCDLNQLKTRIAELSDLANQRDFDGIRAKLRELVPECEPALKFRCHVADLSDPASFEETATPSNMNIESVFAAT